MPSRHKRSNLVVSEIFGPTLQGEGPTAGKPATFLRLGGCNLACSWCDTAYTWDVSRFDLRKELSRDSVRDVLLRIVQHSSERLVISGGEPLLQQEGITSLLERLPPVNGMFEFVEIETAGTRSPLLVDERVHYNVSPKLEHSGNPIHKRFLPEVLEQFIRLDKSCFKFVVQSIHDFDEVSYIVEVLDIPASKVWIMPEGTTSERLTLTTREIADEVVKQGWNFTSRLHVTMWGDERGR